MENKPTYEVLCDANVLMKAARECMKGVTWKYSTQAYYLDRIERVRITRKRLQSFDRMSDGFIVFPVNERGKTRQIKSIHINERVVHRAENDEVLVPVLRPKLIYDNYASLKGRGTRKALDRLKVHLWRYFREHGSNEGHILTADLHAYFDSVRHDTVYHDYKRIFEYDPAITYLTMDFIDAFGEISLGLGSQVSQITAVFHPNNIDHFIKEQLKIRGYGRYNDDFFLIHESREYLEKCLDLIEAKYAEKGIELNRKKTKIVKLSEEFKFLKAKIHMTDTGKVIMRPDHDSITRQRRKLKTLRKKLDAGKITFEDVRQSYNSWKAYISYFNSHRTVRRMDQLFDELFIKEWKGDSRNGKKRHTKYRSGWKHYDFPDRERPAERRYGIECKPERDNLRERRAGGQEGLHVGKPVESSDRGRRT